MTKEERLKDIEKYIELDEKIAKAKRAIYELEQEITRYKQSKNNIRLRLGK